MRFIHCIYIAFCFACADFFTANIASGDNPLFFVAINYHYTRTHRLFATAKATMLDIFISIFLPMFELIATFLAFAFIVLYAMSQTAPFCDKFDANHNLPFA